MGMEFDWSCDIAWPSGNSTENYKNPETEGTCKDLLEQDTILPKDLLGRTKTAKVLYNFIVKNKKGYVLNLDSSWGSGKTWFIRRTCLELQKKHPTCYIDAWENDYKGEAIFLVLSKLIESLREFQRPSTIGKIKNSKIAILSKNLAPEIVKAITKIDLEKISDKYSNESTSLSTHNKIYTDLLGSATKHLLDDFSREDKAINELKKQIAELVDGAIANKKTNELEYPLIVFIDELDRCRPSFAIEMLESVKHIFCIPNIFFIISTHSNELQHSINAVYGERFSSEKYLEKFFDSKLTLSTPSINDFISLSIKKSTIQLFIENTNDIFSSNIENFSEILSGIAISHEIPLRNMQKALHEANSIIMSSDNEKELFAIPLTCLVITKREMPALYNQLIEKHKIINISRSKYEYNQYHNFNASQHASTKHHITSVKLHTSNQFIQYLDCYHQPACIADSNSLFFSILNALINPVTIKLLGHDTSKDYVTLGLDDIAKINYSKVHNNIPSLSRYIDAIEFGGIFD